ncbi:hypothetical protein [Arthrobacter sp. AL12]|uniref:hypothetical protein n=1 Tax=Arthrobacter sp. AL12 TaxID=3042241 RepID=UPI00249B7432|nr:hypothetical protein [Arthrobacter sp. AL12]MDI3211785.1 hypothetical protein [Arthrobacter sp. AL12]
MKLSELVANLQTIQARIDTDPEVVLKVTDHYTTQYQAHDANFKIDANASMHGGYFINGNWMTIDVGLTENGEGKSPKVTFRS